MTYLGRAPSTRVREGTGTGVIVSVTKEVVEREEEGAGILEILPPFTGEEVGEL